MAGDVEDPHRQIKLCGTRRATLVLTRVEDCCGNPSPSIESLSSRQSQDVLPATGTVALE
ncbi:MAG: hypothetical protein ABIZ05_11095 [Pseudonocardiaceae bacterium]